MFSGFTTKTLIQWKKIIFFFRNLISNRVFIIINYNNIVKMIKNKVDQFGFCEAHL